MDALSPLTSTLDQAREKHEKAFGICMMRKWFGINAICSLTNIVLSILSLLGKIDMTLYSSCSMVFYMPYVIMVLFPCYEALKAKNLDKATILGIGIALFIPLAVVIYYLVVNVIGIVNPELFDPTLSNLIINGINFIGAGKFILFPPTK